MGDEPREEGDRRRRGVWLRRLAIWAGPSTALLLGSRPCARPSFPGLIQCPAPSKSLVMSSPHAGCTSPSVARHHSFGSFRRAAPVERGARARLTLEKIADAEMKQARGGERTGDETMTTYRNGRRQWHSEDPARWRDDPRAANGAAQLILRSVCRPRTARPAELARLEAAVCRISSLDGARVAARARV